MPAPDAFAVSAPPPQKTPAPRVVAWLGYGGLIPLVTLATACILDPERQTWWSTALLSYGAVILSFVGALHWGFAMGLGTLSASQRNALFIWSVVPSLLAWPALLLSGAFGSAMLIVGFAAHYAQDIRLARQVALPPWFLPLRLRLTATACACLAVGAVRTMMI